MGRPLSGSAALSPAIGAIARFEPPITRIARIVGAKGSEAFQNGG
jgi:hypothetical protein